MPVWLGRQLGLSHTGAIVLTQVSEIEFRTLYVVAERWIVARTLRFMHETKRSLRHTVRLSWFYQLRPRNLP